MSKPGQDTAAPAPSPTPDYFEEGKFVGGDEDSPGLTVKKSVTISTVNTSEDGSPQANKVSALGDSGLNTSAVTVDSNIISNRSATHRRGQSCDSNVIEKTEHISTEHVRNVFRGSTTVGVVNMEQVERIRQMHDKISDGAEFNFNYCCLLIVASIVAALGLMSDSSTTVISSMLLSPIMGPVIGMSYGLVIWDIPLIIKSAKIELGSIIICIFFGVILGLSCGWTEMADGWATVEMTSRGTRQTFLVGIPIAFFSGLGVALSVLDEQTSSLVGVAISASLLPPAVNCGILFIYALGLKLELREREYFNEEGDFVTMGILSLSLTAVNIIVVWLGAALMFRCKEVLPVKKKVFWDDLKHARRIYQHRAILTEDEDEHVGRAPGIVADAVQNVKEMVISPITRRLSDEGAQGETADPDSTEQGVASN